MADDNATPVLPNVNKAAQAWYDYILRGRRSRVMSPMDEMTWFQAPATVEVQLSGSGVWDNVVATDPMRVAVILSGSPTLSQSSVGSGGTFASTGTSALNGVTAASTTDLSLLIAALNHLLTSDTIAGNVNLATGAFTAASTGNIVEDPLVIFVTDVLTNTNVSGGSLFSESGTYTGPNGTSQDGADSVIYLWFGDAPDASEAVGHVLSPRSPNMVIKQSELGAMAQYQIWAMSPSATPPSIVVTTVSLRQFPQV